MSKINFTSARIDGFKCPTDKQQAFLWDNRSPGLGLRATANGAKAYIFQGKINNRTVRVTIGDPRSWTIEQAQEESRKLQRLIDEGIDPREHKAEQAAVQEAKRTERLRQDVTFGQAWDNYIEARKARWSERHYQDHVSMASEGGVPRKRGKGIKKAGPLAAMRSRKLTDMTPDCISLWLTEQNEERPTMTALAYRLLRAFIHWANDIPGYKGLIPSDAHSARRVKDSVARSKAKDGDCLQREQLASWFAVVRGIPNPVISIYLQGLLLTGARREELAALRWENVDFQWRTLAIGDKVETETGRIIPLTPYLSTQLARLKAINETKPSKEVLAALAAHGQTWLPSPWVFFSKTSADGKIAEPRLAHNKALAEARLPHLSIHGLRRSFGTLAEWVECPTGIVAQIMGHKPSAIVEKHYRRRPIDLLRLWHDKIETWLLAEAGVASPS